MKSRPSATGAGGEGGSGASVDTLLGLVFMIALKSCVEGCSDNPVILESAECVESREDFDCTSILSKPRPFGLAFARSTDSCYLH